MFHGTYPNITRDIVSDSLILASCMSFSKILAISLSMLIQESIQTTDDTARSVRLCQTNISAPSSVLLKDLSRPEVVSGVQFLAFRWMR